MKSLKLLTDCLTKILPPKRPSNFKTPNQLSAKKYKQGKSIGQYLTAKSSSSSNDADPSRNQKILPLRNYPWSDTTTESDESEQEEETSSQEIEGYSSKMKKPGQKTKSRTTSYKSLDANSSIFKPDTSALNDISGEYTRLLFYIIWEVMHEHCT